MRGQHYTNATQSVARWCNKCSASTQHKVDGNKARWCIPCAEKQAQLSREEKAQQMHQRHLEELGNQIDLSIAASAAKTAKRIKERMGIAIPDVEVEVACPCGVLPYPHLHTEGEQRLARIRFLNFQPLPVREVA